MSKEKRQYIRKRGLIFCTMGAVGLIVLFFILHALFPVPLEIDYSQTVTDKKGEILHAFLTKDDKWRMYTELEEISPELKRAIIHKEDKYFYYHPGVNPMALARAFINNITSGERTSGASTITMQVARLLEPKNRSYSNKVVEIFRAFQLELLLEKKEILQLYLNLVPYGGNIEGVKSAAVLYFEKMPNHLSLAEITALAIIPNRPNSLTIGKHNDEIIEQRNKWLRRFKADKVFEDVIIDDALAEQLNAQRHPAPKLAPHFSLRLKYEHPESAIIATTLDLSVQTKAENLVQGYCKMLYTQNIHNAAVMIMDNKTKEVIGYVGSGDFYNEKDGGQVDGIRAIRQPGSTLKPLVYGLAFDKGEMMPLTMLSDVPINFNGYAPVNFDKEYRGYVSVDYALSQSLNVPAVKALKEIGVEKAIEGLVKADFRTIEKQQEILGLSLVLGGCGVTLEELTGLYAAFANDGKYAAPLFLREDAARKGKLKEDSILSKESAFMISEILTGLERPDLPNHWRNASNLPTIAWKTGTSYGRRDAWSVGYNEDYTIGVWVGNFSGEGVPELTGAAKATPLLFQLFNAVDQEKNKNWLTAPKSLPFRLVCSDTGLPPSEKCTEKVFDYYLPLVSSNATCQHLKKIWTNEAESFSYCMHCLPPAGYKEKWIENHPNEMLAYFKFYGIGTAITPPHNPNCVHFLDIGNAPKIVSPTNNAVYYVNSNEIEEMVFQCQAAANIEKVFWYVDDVFIQETGKTESVLWLPEDGLHKISCSDDSGHNTDITIEVNFIKF